MSRVRADKWTNRAGSGAPTLTYGVQCPTGYGITGAGGINVTGVVTATSFSGSGANLTGIAATEFVDAASLTVSGISTFAQEVIVTAGGIEVNGGGLDIAGITTFAGSKNTFANEVNVTAGGAEITAGGLQVTAGISTIQNATATDVVISVGATVGMNTITTTSTKIGTAVTFSQSYINFNQLLIEKTNTAGTTLGAATTCGLEKGMVYYCTGNESGNLTVNFMHQAPTGDGNAGTALTSIMAVGETVSPTVILTPNNSGVINALQIDGTAQTIEATDDAFSTGANGYDMYSFTLLRTGTGATDWLVLGSKTNHT